MANLNNWTAIGRVTRVEPKTIKSKEGEELQITNLNIAVHLFKPGRGGADGTESTIWVQASQFHSPSRGGYNLAQKWAEKFTVGSIVHLSGAVELAPYIKSDGTAAANVVLQNPQVDLVPQSKQASAEQADLFFSGSAQTDSVPF